MGSADRLAELEDISDDVHGRHDQGGLSQPRYQRSIEEDVGAHLRRVAEELHRLWRDHGFEHLLVGATPETYAAFEDDLHPELRRPLLGRFDAELQTATPDTVLEAVRPFLEQAERRRVEAALERLDAGLAGSGAAVAGLEPVREALTERRVETLLLAEGFDADAEVEAAIGQSADVLILPADELGPRGPIAAVLRF